MHASCTLYFIEKSKPELVQSSGLPVPVSSQNYVDLSQEETSQISSKELIGIFGSQITITEHIID